MVSIRSIVERMRNVPFGNITLEAAEKSFFLAKFLCFCHVANNYFCSIAQVYGPSMLPAINLAGDLVLVERISHRIGHVGRGDIVIVRSPEIPTKTITKRITGMEGDTVTFAVDPGQEDRWKTIVVPKGHVWVQGDNVFESHDSRNFGPVPYSLIQSKALIRVEFNSFLSLFCQVAIAFIVLFFCGWMFYGPSWQEGSYCRWSWPLTISMNQLVQLTKLGS